MINSIFEIYFSDGRIHTQHASNALHAVIMAQSNAIQNGLSISTDSIVNEETGKVYQITQTVKPIGVV